MTDFNASFQRLLEAKKQAMFRQAHAEIERRTKEVEWRAEYEPVIRESMVDAGHHVIDEIAKMLLTDDEVGDKLADALRERHAVADPLATRIVATVRSVLSALVADIEVVCRAGEDSDASPLVP